MTPLFANPAFLWALPVAALPVIFHLFLRVRKRPRPFSTLMFFHRIDPRLSARKRIREWVILLLRTLLILLALLALARPRWFAGWGGGSVSIVLVVDNSGSMAGAPLRTAAEAAHALLTALDRTDTAGLVLLVDDPTFTAPAGLVSDRAALNTALNRLVETEATGNVGDALRRAFALLETGNATRFEVHLFTDVQEPEWARANADLPAPRAGTKIVVHRIRVPALTGANVSLAGIELPQRRSLAGRPIVVRAALRNTGPAPATVRLNAIDDAGQQQSQEVAVPAGEDKTTALLFTAATPGFHWLNLWLDGDAFPADNRAGIGVVCAGKSAVLLVGAPNEFGVLPVALSPGSDGQLSGLIPQFVSAEALPAALADAKPLLVVSTEMPPRRYVEQGGNVLLMPRTDAIETRAEGAPALVFQKGAALFDDLRDEKGEVALRNVRVFRFAPLTVNPNATALLGLEDGRPLLTEERLGNGRVFASAVGFDAQWSTLPLKGGFLALAQSMALIGDEPSNTVTRLVAGERVAGLGGNEPTHIRSLTGSPLDWKGKAAEAPVFPRAGVYAVEVNGQVNYVSVRASEKEGRWQYVSGSAVPALGGLAHSVRLYTSPETLAAEFRTISRGVDLYLPLFLAALVALVTEGWLANQPPKKVKS